MALPTIPTFTAGQPVLGSDLAALATHTTFLQNRTLGWANRITNSTASAAEHGVLRIDNINVLSGHAIQIRTSTLILASSVAGDVVTALLRLSTSGAATTSSTQIGQCAGVINATAGAPQNMHVIYIPTADQTISVILTVLRAVGTGNASINNGGANFPTEIVIEDLGIAPSDTGVDL